jgi:hypothetical protein
VVAVATTAAMKLHAAENDGWTSLFDGKEDVAKNYWSVQDGAVTCDSRGRKQHGYVWLKALTNSSSGIGWAA